MVGRLLPPDGGPEEPGGDGPDTLAEGIGAMLAEVGAHAGAIYRLTPDRRVLELVVMEGLTREFVRPWERVSLTAPAPVADAFRERRLVWVGGEEEMVRRYPGIALALPYEFCLAAMPLVTATAAYGAMFVVWPGSHASRLSSGERARLRSAAGGLARTLEEIVRTGRLGRTDQEPLVLVPPSAGQTEEVEAMMARLPEGLCTLDNHGRLTFISPRGAALIGESPRRLVGAQPWTVLPWLNDPVYEDRYRGAMISQQPTSFVALRPPDRWLSFDLYPSVSGITVRITPAPVEPQDVPELTPTVDPAMPTRVGAIYHVLHLASALTEVAGVQDVVNLVADHMMPAFGGQAMALLTAEDGRLSVVGHRGYQPDVTKHYERLPLTSPTPSVRTMIAGVPSFFESSEDLDQIYPLAVAPDDGMAAWAFVPLIASGRPIGTWILAFSRPHRFTVEERAVLTSLGGLLAQALERARLYDTKLELAHGLQEGLLPHALPRLPGLTAAARYLPGTEGMDIGGDFYDVIRLTDETVAAIVGDVQGHNVTAAALMGQLRTAVRAYTTAGADPGEVLARTNHLLTDLDPGLFATCVYAHLDLRHHVACLTRAGHPQPLLRSPDGDVQVLDVAGGLMLGVDPEAEYPRTEIPLRAGSTLALYTDGLIETPGVDLDDALAELGSVLADTGGQHLDDVADALIRYAQQTSHRSDDIALLLLRLTAGLGP
ncbi:SpoIIE family protein phosphatase [Streptosporangium sp. CA-135522]|uniref:PP2C family protein-serine/threonine phosphatase n=1 Tax=Streptosporangium sp. CA-135522 TaxID=3240072 RepID=UPI003D8DF79E